MGAPAQHTSGLGSQKECSVQITEVHFSEPFCSVFCVEVYGVCHYAGPSSHLQGDCQPPRLLVLSLLWSPAGTLLGRRDFRPKHFGHRDSPVPLGWLPVGWTLNSSQYVLECDSGAKRLTFKNVMFITLTTDFSHFFSENFSTYSVPGLGGFRDERREPVAFWS